MTAYDVEELLAKYKQGTASEEEVTFLLSVVQEWTENSALEIEEDEFLLVRAEISEALDKENQHIKTTLLWQRMVGIVATVALISIGIYFFNKQYMGNRDPELVLNSKYSNDINPGIQGATLTLANGKKIKLNDAANGEVANEAGIIVRKTADGHVSYEIASQVTEPLRRHLNTLSTAKGETYRVTLPDHSTVWLNAGSTLTYFTTINIERQRHVQLEGEAYFEISKDRLHPFIVESKGQEIEVLGTHFNVSAYNNDAVTKTTLLEGSVKISASKAAGGGIEALLRPGEESILSKDNIEINKADIERATAWKNNKFMFESEPIQNIMKVLERWYNIEVVYLGMIPEYKFGGSVSKFDHVSKVLQVLESTNKVHFKIEGRRIFVTR